MQVVLVMFRSDGERRSFSVVRDITVLGRREDCDLRIPLGDVSRKHCRLIRTDAVVRIEDLGSSNGTLVNGERVNSHELRPGDTVAVGPVTFVVQINGIPGDDELMPFDQRQTAQDTALAAAAVGVGTLTEVEPPDAEGGLMDLDEAAEEDLGAAPLIASAEGDDDEAVAALEPLDEAEALDELEPIEELEPLAELEPIEEIAELDPVDGPLRPAAPVPAAHAVAPTPSEEPEAIDALEPIEENSEVIAGLEPVGDEADGPTPVAGLSHVGDPLEPESEVVTAAPAPTPALPTPVAPAAKGRAAAPAKPPAAKARNGQKKLAPPPPPVPTEPVEGELQESGQFAGVPDQTGFEIVMDEPAQNSFAGDVEIDWNAESKV